MIEIQNKNERVETPRNTIGTTLKKIERKEREEKITNSNNKTPMKFFLLFIYLSFCIVPTLQASAADGIDYPERPLPNNTKILESKENGYVWPLAIIGTFTFPFATTGPCIFFKIYIIIISIVYHFKHFFTFIFSHANLYSFIISNHNNE